MGRRSRALQQRRLAAAAALAEGSRTETTADLQSNDRAVDQQTPPDDGSQYVMKISRLTIDKLGVKLYDKVSAAVAELVANAYDADAETVRVKLPLQATLGRKYRDGSIEDLGYAIEVVDDGHGMTPEEANEQFLQVGRDRRRRVETRRSRAKMRYVMGRKGIGKLAPFGICHRIEVISAGGEQTEKGYLVSHFIMDYPEIMKQDDDTPAVMESGDQDRTYKSKSGTIVRLTQFLNKRVPDADTFNRQLATRFAFADPDFTIKVEDLSQPGSSHVLQHIDIPKLPGTEVDLAGRPVPLEDETFLPVSGWLAFAKEAYKTEELAGVRIYARNKIVATTRDFEQPAGFTGEFRARSYLVGEVHAEWLDLDEGEDLVRTDRQGIIWDSEYGQALRRWGAELIKEIARNAAQPARRKKQRTFLEMSNIEEKAALAFEDEQVIRVAVELAEQIGGFAAEDELSNREYVDGLTSFIIAVAPHKALMQAFQDFSAKALNERITFASLQELFGKTRVAEMASYSQIAAERVRVIDELEGIMHGDSNESDLQRLIAGAPWLIEPTWTVISKNQALKTFKKEFEQFYRTKTGESVTLAIEFEGKRPDFTLVSVGRRLHVVEIKAAGHAFNDEDFSRFYNYVDTFEQFFSKHTHLHAEFPLGFVVDLVADEMKLNQSQNQRLWSTFQEKQLVTRITWMDFLHRTRTAHEELLNVRDRVREIGGS